MYMAIFSLPSPLWPDILQRLCCGFGAMPGRILWILAQKTAGAGKVTTCVAVRILAMLPPPTAHGYVNSRGEMGRTARR